MIRRVAPSDRNGRGELGSASDVRCGAGRAFVLFALATLTACSPGYVVRAAYEEARILWRREPVADLLAGSALDVETRGKLESLLAVRRYAEERVGLRVGGSYRAVSQVDGGAVVQLLTAAHRDRLESVTWWFPIVGRVPYKGFFSKSDAEASRRDLEEGGYDTYLRPAIAFSTLGWFDDPLPSTLLRKDRVTLAEVVLHELFHNTLFVPGEVAFNESAATFVGNRGAIEFFCGEPGREAAQAASAECANAGDLWQDTLEMSRFVAAAAVELGAFYASSPQGTALDEGRARIFDGIRERFGALALRTRQYSGFGSDTLNNASLLQERTYLRELDVFEDLYRRRGTLGAAVEAIRTATARGGDPFSRLEEAVAATRPEVALEQGCTVDSGRCE